MNRKLGAAVIGLGEGTRHMKAYQENPEYELLAVCDTDSGILNRRTAEFPFLRTTLDYRDILKMKDVDVVSIASPDFFHAEQSIAAMEAGKHVLCEKPMTLCLEEARAIIDAVRRTQRTFMIAHPTRYTPAFCLAREMIRNGEIGKLFMVESEYEHNYEDAKGFNNWRMDSRRDPLLGGGCHAVDLVRWITDAPIEEAFAYTNHLAMPLWPVNDSYLCLFKFANGVIGRVTCSIGVNRPYTMRSVFSGTEGTIVCDNMSDHILFAKKAYPYTMDAGGKFASIPLKNDSHNVVSQVALMADIVLRGQENHAGAVEGARTIAACIAAIESAKTGLPVRVQNDF